MSLVVDINSDLRETGTSGEFTYRIALSSQDEYDRVSLLGISLPKSMYLVSDNFGGNTFHLTEQSTTVTITLPEGNYTSRQLVTTLNTLLNASSLWTYTVSFSSSLGKLSFSVTGNSSQPTISFPTSSSLFSVMGFNEGSSNVFSSNTLASSNVIMLTVGTILVKTDLVESNWISDVTGNTLASFSLANTPNFGVFEWVNPDPVISSRALSQRSNTSWYFWLTDIYDNSIDLSGLPLVLSIVLFKSDRSGEFITQDIKLRWMENNIKEL